MKKSILTFGVLFMALLTISSTTFAQEAKVGGAEISLDKETHDYGVMKQHADGECVFLFLLCCKLYSHTQYKLKVYIILMCVGHCQKIL